MQERISFKNNSSAVIWTVQQFLFQALRWVAGSVIEDQLAPSQVTVFFSLVQMESTPFLFKKKKSKFVKNECAQYKFERYER
jgi:hypothetical protein